MTVNNGNRPSVFTKGQAPAWLLEMAPKFIRFIELYYQWLEQTGKPVDVARKLFEYGDVDRAPEKFFDFIRNEFMVDIPKAVVTDRRTLLKNIQDFYRSRGSEKSFELLFRILYNEEVSFYYPAEDILRASDGIWVVERILTIRSTTEASVFDYLGRDVYGAESNAKGRLERIVGFLDNGVTTYYCYLSNVFGTFQNEKIITISGNFEIGTAIDYDVMDGYWQGTRGFLSSNKYLQDNYYYQEYSYELRSGQPTQNYKAITDKLVHPAGMIMFGQIWINRLVDMSIQDVTRDKVDLEITVTNDSNLLVGVGSDTAFNDFTDLVDSLYEFLLTLSITPARQTTVFDNLGGNVTLLLDDDLADIETYTLGELQNVTNEDLLAQRVVVGSGSTLTDDLVNGQKVLYYDAINTNDLLFLDEVKVLSSNVCVTNKRTWFGTDTLSGDKIAKVTYDSVEE